MADVKYQHVTDPPSYVMSDGQILDGVRIERTGSTRGRFIFKHSPMIVVPAGVVGVEIRNCHLRGFIE